MSLPIKYQQIHVSNCVKPTRELSTDFVPSPVVTPAQVQNFLQTCRGDPDKALGDIDAWVEENRGSAETATARTSDSSESLVSHPTAVDSD